MPGSVALCPAGAVLSWAAKWRSYRESEQIEDGREVRRISSKMQQLEQPQTAPAVEMQAVSTLSVKVSAASGGEGWKLMTSGSNGKAPAPS